MIRIEIECIQVLLLQEIANLWKIYYLHIEDDHHDFSNR
jgi:hypothetical protein